MGSYARTDLLLHVKAVVDKWVLYVKVQVNNSNTSE